MLGTCTYTKAVCLPHSILLLCAFFDFYQHFCHKNRKDCWWHDTHDQEAGCHGCCLARFPRDCLRHDARDQEAGCNGCYLARCPRDCLGHNARDQEAIELSVSPVLDSIAYA